MKKIELFGWWLISTVAFSGTCVVAWKDARWWGIAEVAEILVAIVIVCSPRAPWNK